MSEAKTLFTRIIERDIPAEIVHETATVIAFKDINPQANTHILVVPKAVYRNALELAEADPALLAELVRTAGAIAAEQGIAESGYRLVFNTDADAGQTVFHVHLHLLGGEPLGLFGHPGKGEPQE
ncbi:histidine triad (HIT) family protein [Tamaricihabitans halophyticus]|uniref:Histidine triad (HIT) family protein n=1 Tax=Tamaricihabitans halophyticus TaxID=1262583 RepID=A0A4R2R0D9_9PSEU|nr:histidine triad nucleotide-binding protein [Tamaricihabitans halophyticus]TCP54898.1 histidine triad (HIT) family protein [Tamaricihabitans halophyticus]